MKRLLSLLLLLVALPTIQAAETVLFEDPLATELQSGWRWLREDPQDWRFRADALEIRVRPGNAQTVRCPPSNTNKPASPGIPGANPCSNWSRNWWTASA